MNTLVCINQNLILTQEFSLCKQLTDDRFEHLILWIENSFGNLAMMDYPYPTNFLAPLPAWPIRLSCQIVMQNQNRPLYGYVGPG